MWRIPDTTNEHKTKYTIEKSIKGHSEKVPCHKRYETAVIVVTATVVAAPALV